MKSATALCAAAVILLLAGMAAGMVKPLAGRLPQMAENSLAPPSQRQGKDDGRGGQNLSS